MIEPSYIRVQTIAIKLNGLEINLTMWKCRLRSISLWSLQPHINLLYRKPLPKFVSKRTIITSSLYRRHFATAFSSIKALPHMLLLFTFCLQSSTSQCQGFFSKGVLQERECTQCTGCPWRNVVVWLLGKFLLIKPEHKHFHHSY